MCKHLKLISLLALCLITTRCPGQDAKKCDPLVDSGCQLAESSFHSSLVTIQTKLAKECSPPVKPAEGGSNGDNDKNTDKYLDIRVFNTDKARACYKIWQDTAALSDLPTRCKRYHEIISKPFIQSLDNACTENYQAVEPKNLNADWDYSNPARYGKVLTSTDPKLDLKKEENASYRCYDNGLLATEYKNKYRGHYCESGPKSCTASMFKNTADITDGRECPGRCVTFKKENDKQCIQGWPTTDVTKELFKVCDPNASIHCVKEYKGSDGKAAAADTCLKYAKENEPCNPNGIGKPKCSGEGEYLHCVANKGQDVSQSNFVGSCKFFAAVNESCSVNGKEYPKCDPNGEALHCVGSTDKDRTCKKYAEAGEGCSDNAGTNKLPMCNPDTSFCDMEDKFKKRQTTDKNPVCVSIVGAGSKCFTELDASLANINVNIQPQAPYGVQSYSQCLKDLVCMPPLKSTGSEDPFRCLSKIKEDQECDESYQCETGLQCGYSKTAIQRKNIAKNSKQGLKKVCLGKNNGPGSSFTGLQAKKELEAGTDCGIIKELKEMDTDKVTDLKYMEIEITSDTINMSDPMDPKTNFNVTIACNDDVYDDRHDKNNGQDVHGVMYCATKDQEKIIKVNGTDVTRNLNDRQRCYRLVSANEYCESELTGDKTTDTGAMGVLSDPKIKFICGYAKTTGNDQNIYKPMKCENNQCKVQELKMDPPKELDKCSDPVLAKEAVITPPK